MCIMCVYLDVCSCAFFLGSSSIVFIALSEETMTHKRLRTTLVQPPHIIDEEIESREASDCRRSHSQDQNQVPWHYPPLAGSLNQDPATFIGRTQVPFPMPFWLAWIQLNRLEAFNGSGQLGTHCRTFLFPVGLIGHLLTFFLIGHLSSRH